MSSDLRHLFGLACLTAAGALGVVLMFELASATSSLLLSRWWLILAAGILAVVGLTNVNHVLEL